MALDTMHNEGFERMLIAGIFLQDHADAILGKMRHDDFALDRSLIFASAREVWERGVRPNENNIMTLVNKAVPDGAIVNKELHECLFESPPNLDELQYYVHEVQALGERRRLIARAQQLQTALASGEDVDKALQAFNDQDDLTAGLIKQEGSDVAKEFDDFFNLLKAGEVDTGISYFLPDLQRNARGKRKGQCIVYGAATGGGKSSFLYNDLLHTIKQKKKDGSFVKAIVVSMEITSLKVWQNLLIIDGKIPAHVFDDETGKLPTKYASVYEASYKRLKPYLDNVGYIAIGKEQPRITVESIKAKIRREKPDIVYVDYLQLVDSYKDIRVRQEMIEYISRQFKMLALEMDIPIILLSQFNREESKAGEPAIHHIRGSGAIAQDADVVMLGFKVDSSGNKSEVDDTMTGKLKVNNAGDEYREEYKIKIVKNRDGALTTIECWFDGDTKSFYGKSITEMRS